MKFSPILFFIYANISFAAGMQPEITAIVMDASQETTSINVTNTDGHKSLLYTTVSDVVKNDGVKVIPTQPLMKVEGLQIAKVRFVLKVTDESAFKTQVLKKVAFEGIPEKNNDGKFGVTFRQIIPLIVSPKGLASNDKPWRLLKWSCGNVSYVENPSPYLVRIMSEITTKSGRKDNLGKTFILPGEKIVLNGIDNNSCQSGFNITPLTVYGTKAEL